MSYTRPGQSNELPNINSSNTKPASKQKRIIISKDGNESNKNIVSDKDTSSSKKVNKMMQPEKENVNYSDIKNSLPEVQSKGVIGSNIANIKMLYMEPGPKKNKKR